MAFSYCCFSCFIAPQLLLWIRVSSFASRTAADHFYVRHASILTFQLSIAISFSISLPLYAMIGPLAPQFLQRQYTTLRCSSAFSVPTSPQNGQILGSFNAFSLQILCIPSINCPVFALVISCRRCTSAASHPRSGCARKSIHTNVKLRLVTAIAFPQVFNVNQVVHRNPFLLHAIRYRA